jgi:L-ascorbate 6-phosphate lactonase
MGTLKATWFGQAGFLLEGQDGTAVLLDPFLSEYPGRRYPPPVTVDDLPERVTVLATHEHDDHLDRPFLRQLAASGQLARLVVPQPIAAWVRHEGLSQVEIVGAEPDRPLALDGITVYPVPAWHGVGGEEPVAYGFTSLRHPDEGYRFLGYVVELGGVRWYHAGDTLVYEGMAERLRTLRPDVMAVPINGRDAVREGRGIVGNMTEDEAAALCREVEPRVAVPMHYEGIAGNLGELGRFAEALGPDEGVPLLAFRRARPIWLYWP